MIGERPAGRRILSALIACLTAAILLLGVELALALRDSDRLSYTGTGALAVVAALLYAAISWRSAQDREGLRTFAGWWGTMLVAHLGLGFLIGVFQSTLTGAALSWRTVLQWAGGLSLPVGVLQVGYAVGVTAVAYGNGSEGGTVPQAPVEPAIETEPHQVVWEKIEAAEESYRPANIEVYVAAIDRLQAPDVSSLLRFATQASRCDGALVANRLGQVIAAVNLERPTAARVAETLPKLMDNLQRLGCPSTPGATMVRAASCGYEILAAAGAQVIACLVGPQPDSRDIAEIMLPVLVARVEAVAQRNHEPPEARQNGVTPMVKGDWS